MMLLLSSSRSRNCFPLRSEAWNVIFQIFRMSLLLLFLLKSYEVLLEKSGVELKALVSLSTTLWRDQLRWLGHSQNSMELFWCWRKNHQSSAGMATEWTWKRCEDGSKIFLAIWVELVMMMILEMSLWFEAWLIPYLIAKSSALVLVMWTMWWTVLVIGLSWMCICDINVATSFLILVSMTTMVVEEELDASMTILSSWWAQALLSFCLLCKLNTKWSEKLSIIL